MDLPPHVINSLSVSAKGEKKRLILDLRHLNLHVFRNKIKFDDWRIMQDFMERGGYRFKFDLKRGYHHIDVHEDLQKYWDFHGSLMGYVDISFLQFYLLG